LVIAYIPPTLTQVSRLCLIHSPSHSYIYIHTHTRTTSFSRSKKIWCSLGNIWFMSDII
jgi:hypothetical protein